MRTASTGQRKCTATLKQQIDFLVESFEDGETS
jgi:hypothetical protein